MNAVLYPICAAIAWIASFYKLRRLWKENYDPVLAALCAGLIFLAMTLTVSTPIVWVGIDRLFEFSNLSALLSQSLVMAFSAAMQVVLLLAYAPPGNARQQIQRRLTCVGVVLVTMAILFLLAPPMAEAPTDFVLRYSGEPHIARYLSFYIGAFAVMQLENTRLALKAAKAGGRPWLRRGLRILAAGSVLGLVYCVGRAVAIMESQFGLGLDMHRWEALTRIVISLGVLFVSVGFTIPAWGPRLSALLSWIDRYISYHRLYPLWNALHQAFPSIALYPRSSRIRDIMAIRDLNFRIYRRVIEIQDGKVALRSFFDSKVAISAQREAEKAGLAGDELQVTIEASQLKFALSVMNQDAGSFETPTIPSVDSNPNGTDISTEIKWLVQVARAFVNSPVVQVVCADIQDSKKRPSRLRLS